MASKTRTIKINSLNGGKGDIWMRLVSLYAISKIKNIYFEVTVPGNMLSLTKDLFAQRLKIQAIDTAQKFDYTYTSLGIRHILKKIFNGNKFVLPYALMVYKEKKKRTLKDHINLFFLQILHLTGAVQISSLKNLKYYQGFTDVTSIKLFKDISYDDFIRQLNIDSDHIRNYLKNNLYSSNSALEIDSVANQVIIFPTGTGRQFFPIWWCKLNMPGAYYAIYYDDAELLNFKENGLNTIAYSSPEDIIELAKHARWCVSSDSFPSHLLQYARTNNCIIAITGTPAYRVVSPVYKGKIADAKAPCHPCIHLDRHNHPYCEAGHQECINWKNKAYTDDITSSINFHFEKLF